MPLSDQSALIVDDNPSDRLIVKAILKQLRVGTIHEAENANIALGKVENFKDVGHNYNLIFLDWNMPGLGGLKLLQTLRGNSAYKSIKIIIMTATSHPEIVQDAIDAGADDFIVKPVTAALVREKLKIPG